MTEDLLNELRINHRDRDANATPRWMHLAIVPVILGFVAFGWWIIVPRSLAVEVVKSESVGGESTPGAILQATGYVTARLEATVSAQVTGQLTEVRVEEGEHVVKGQVLARLDDADAKAAVAVSRAQLAVDRSNVAQFLAEARLARESLVRQRALVKQGLVARQTYDQAVSSEMVATASLEASEHQVQLARAQLDEADVTYGYTFIRAPFSGVITDKAAQVGEIISPLSAGGGFTRTGVATIVDMNSLEVDVDVSESYIHRVRAGEAAYAVLDAYPDWHIPARVIAIVPTADKAKATVKVRVALLSKSTRILPNMGVRVSFLENQPATEIIPKGVMIPQTAIVSNGDAYAVFLLSGDRVHLTPVTLGRSFGDMRLVTGGLESGSLVVISPPATLRNGIRVRVIAAKP